jgi:glycolate oxidase iron-sulfur subunit
MAIEKHYDEIARCNRCGFCQVACPIFRSTGHEAGVARGRLALLRALVENRISWNAELEEPLFACLLCGACTANCFPAVPTADLIVDARSQYLDRVGRNPLHRLLFDHLLPYPKRLRLAARAAALGKRSGLSKVAKALGLLRIFGRDFPRAEEIVSDFPDKALREKVPPGALEGTGDLRIGYFVGCGTDVMCPETAEATLRVLRRMGRTVQVLDNCCCGLPPITYGDRDAARRLADKNLRLLRREYYDLVVTDCSSCAAFLKKYPLLFEPDDPRHAMAVAFAGHVRDVAELIAAPGTGSFFGPFPAEKCACPLPAQGGQSHFRGQGRENWDSPLRGQGRENWDSPPQGPTEKVVATYHDPCHASRGQGLTKPPREVLRSIEGVEFRELPEADWCCGGAGSYALTHFELSRKVLDRKLDNVEKTGASLLVTSCPACIIQLRYGVRKRGLPIRVCHIAELAGRGV